MFQNPKQKTQKIIFGGLALTIFVILLLLLGQSGPSVAQSPTPTLPPLEYIQITNSVNVSRSATLQAQPGDILDLFLATEECCYVMVRVEVPVTWSVSPADTATIEADGVLTIHADALHGVRVVVAADLGGGQTVTQTIVVYSRESNPLVGEWVEIAQTLCEGGTEIVPNDPMGELVFDAAGNFRATWFPFEVYFDFAGQYQFDVESGDLLLTQVSAINYLPQNLDGTGKFSLNADGDLILAEMWLGEPPNGRAEYPPICGHRFTQDYARARSEQERLAAEPAAIYGQVRWNEQPVEGIVVNLRTHCFAEEPNYHAEAITDAEGRYRFDTAPPGDYVLAFNSWDDTANADSRFSSTCSGNQFILFAGQQLEENRDFVKLDLQVTPIENAAPATPTLSWEAYPDAAYYEVTLSRVPLSNYEPTIDAVRTAETSLVSPVELGQGMHYSGWIYAYNENGVVLAMGDILDFDIQVAPVPIDPADEGAGTLEPMDATALLTEISGGNATYTYGLSPDSTTIAWLSLTSELCLYTFADEQTICHPLSDQVGEMYYYPSFVWSPDSHYLAFTESNRFATGSTAAIWLFKVADGTTTLLVPPDETRLLGYSLWWGPSNLWGLVSVANPSLYFLQYDVTGETETIELYRMGVTDTQPEFILDLTELLAAGELMSAASSPDGRQMALLVNPWSDSEAGGVHLIDVATGQIEQLVTATAVQVGLPQDRGPFLQLTQVAWMNDGRALIVNFSGFYPFDSIGLMSTRIELESGKFSPLFDLSTIENSMERTAWGDHPIPVQGQVTPDNRFLFYVTSDPETYGLSLRALPLAEANGESVMVQESLRLECGLNHSLVTLREAATTTRYLLEFSWPCGE